VRSSAAPKPGNPSRTRARLQACRSPFDDDALAHLAIAATRIALALALGYTISWSLIGPVKEIERRLNQIAAGDFTQRVHVANRDELGTLAANVNKMCEELGHLYGQIEAASQHKSQFLASMSHELRTPLNAIIGLTEMMVTNSGRFGTEKALEPLRRVNASGTHLLSLINEILDLSKIEAGKLELNPERVDLAQLIDESSAPRNSLPRRTTTASSSRRTKTWARSPRTPCGSSRFCSIS